MPPFLLSGSQNLTCARWLLGLKASASAEIGRGGSGTYRIDDANALPTTNWVPLTVLTLPTSP